MSVGFIIMALFEKFNLRRKELVWPVVLEVPMYLLTHFHQALLLIVPPANGVISRGPNV